MIDDKLEDDPIPSRSPRRGAVELLQVLSLLLLPVAFLLLEGGFRIALVCVSLALAVVPFFLIRLPEREPYVDWSRGFQITPERLRILVEIDVPEDIVLAIENSMIDVYYPKRKDLRAALLRVLGEDRVQPWLNDIVRHAKYYGDPPALGPEASLATAQPETGTAEDSHNKTAAPKALGEFRFNPAPDQQTGEPGRDAVNPRATPGSFRRLPAG